jgi:16S rRNA (uracil1498-N3)-methyltransferase
MANRFYTSFALSPGPVTIQGPEAHHLATVRRFHVGDAVVLFNGDGNEYAAEIVSIDRKAIALNVLHVDQANRELAIDLVVACAIPKGDRADFLVEKLTELGVTELVPLETERSVVKPREAKIERWSRAVIEASKQCGRNRLMQIPPMIDWPEFCRQPHSGFRKLLADPQASRSALPHPAANVCIAVGPEGGFSDGEIALAREAAWETVSLGPRTLRVETAAIALAALFAFRL